MRRTMTRKYPAQSRKSEINLHTFAGVHQGTDENDLDRKFSKTAINCDTTGGSLKPSPGYAVAAGFPPTSAPIRTLMAYFRSSDSAAFYLAATDNDILLLSGGAWTSIKGAQPVSSGRFGYLNYQDGTTDIITLTNGADEPYEWTGTGNLARLTPSGDLAPKGADITLSNERIFMAALQGAAGNTVAWSDDLHPTKWTVATDDAGSLLKPTWDGELVTAVYAMFNAVFMFKRHSIWRILGTYPGEFESVQVHTTSGTESPNTICQWLTYAFFLSFEGIMEYDGATCAVLGGDALRDVYARINPAARQNACAAVYNNKLLMAIPTGTSTTNNEVIEYDLLSKTFMMRDIRVDCWLTVGTTLYFSADKQVYVYGSGVTYAGAPIAMQWDVPVSDLGAPEVVKRFDTVYLTGKGGAVDVVCIADGDETTTTLALPNDTGVVEGYMSAAGRMVGFSVKNKAGNTPEISGIKALFEGDED